MKPPPVIDTTPSPATASPSGRWTAAAIPFLDNWIPRYDRSTRRPSPVSRSITEGTVVYGSSRDSCATTVRWAPFSAHLKGGNRLRDRLDIGGDDVDVVAHKKENRVVTPHPQTCV